MRLGSNTDQLPYFEVEPASSEESRPVYAQFLDAAVVQMLNPGTAKTLLDYAVHVFCHVCTRKSSTRVDIVWDVHQTNRLNGTTKDGQVCAETSCSLRIDS